MPKGSRHFGGTNGELPDQDQLRLLIGIEYFHGDAALASLSLNKV